MRGFYVAFEGTVACGKTTQSKLLKLRLEKEFPDREVIWTREPGGTPVGDAIREVVLHFPTDKGEMLPITEAHLFAGSRGQSLREVVKPTLDRGGIVVSDRSFYSSLAFQGFGRGLGVDLVEEINLSAVAGIIPDKVILADIRPEVGLLRKAGRLEGNDRFDEKDIRFHQKVREGYLFLAQREPERFIVVDGELPIETQAELIWEKFSPSLDRELRQEGRIRLERG